MCEGSPKFDNNTKTTEKLDFTFGHCPRCKYYIDKQFIYKDENIQITMGTVKECKFRTDTSWICDFKEDKNGNEDN